MVDGLDYLEHYPYECTEQTVSRFLPNVLTYRAFKDYDLDHLLDQLCYGAADIDAPNAFTDFPGPPKSRRGGRDDEQFV